MSAAVDAGASIDQGEIRRALGYYEGLPGCVSVMYLQEQGATPSYASYATTAAELDQAMRDIVKADLADEPLGIYLRGTTVAEGVSGRGVSEDTVAWLAFRADLDLDKPGGPPTWAELVAAFELARLPTPTYWQHSGGGFYPTWMLDAPVAHGPDVETLAADIEAELRRTWQQAGYSAGVDSCHDAARVWRLAGSVHRKNRAAPITSTTGKFSGELLTFEQLRERVPHRQRPKGWDGQRTAPRRATAEAFEQTYRASLAAVLERGRDHFRHTFYVAARNAHRMEAIELRTREEWRAELLELVHAFWPGMGFNGDDRQHIHDALNNSLERGDHAGALASPWELITPDPGEYVGGVKLREGAGAVERPASPSSQVDAVDPVDPDGEPEAAEPMSDEEAKQFLRYRQDVAEEKRKQRIRRQAKDELAAEERPPDPGPSLTSLADLLAEPDDAESYRIDQLWPVGGKVLLSAPQKSGKTTLVGNLVRALADGTRFLSRPVAAGQFKVAAAGFQTEGLDGRRIALFDFEMTRRKLRDWLRDQRIANPGAVHVELMRGRVWDVRDPAIRRQWAQYLSSLNVGIVMVDPIGPVLGSLGIDENDNSAVAAFLFALDALVRESGADELFVTHHAGHNGERARGASAFLGWPDANWTLVRDEMSNTRAFRAEGRDVWVPETTLVYDRATRRLGLGEGDRTTARSAGHAEIMAGIVAENPGESLNKLKAFARDTEIGTKVQHAQDAVKAAEAAGLIHAHRGPNRARLHYPGACGSACTDRDLPLADLQ